MSTSPYGTNPSGPDKACPSGYTQKYVEGYGWVCSETATAENKNFQQLLDHLSPLGINLSDTGVTPVAGMTVEEEVAKILSYLESRYHHVYVVLPQPADHGILITSASRAAADGQLPNPEVSGSTTDPAMDQAARDEAAAWAAQYSRQYRWPYHVWALSQPDAVDYIALAEGAPHPTDPPGGTVTRIGTYTDGTGSVEPTSATAANAAVAS